MKNQCLHCKCEDKWGKECCMTCKGTGFTSQHIHKGNRNKFNYPLCNPNCNSSPYDVGDNAIVTRRWDLVTCKKCLKLKSREK